MRDPERIKMFCDRLAYLWLENCPDWRFTQLVENVFRSGIAPKIPFFYCEDDETLELFNRYFEEK